MNEITRKLQSLSKKHFSDISQWAEIPSDASNRFYYRFVSKARKVVCVDSRHEPNTMTKWLNMHKILKNNAIRVPEVLAIESSHHCYWITDHGNENYLKNVSSVEPKRIISLLQQLQSIQDINNIDHEYSKICLQTFANYMVDTLNDHDKETFSAIDLSWLHDCYKAADRGFCHADFHGGNIMIDGTDIILIDFQDACIRPLAYDWASWLYDFYHDFSTELRSMIITNHIPSDYNGNIRKWQFDIALCGLLRSLRVLGRFTALQQQPGKSKYALYLPTVRRRALYFASQLPEAHLLTDWLKNQLYGQK